MSPEHVDHCTVEILDQVLDTKQVLELPTSVAEAAADCVEVMKAKFFLRWCEDLELFSICEYDKVRCEPIGVVIIQRADSITVIWHVVGLEDDAVFRRREILRGNWCRGEVDRED
jgi:hypothetical protein